MIAFTKENRMTEKIGIKDTMEVLEAIDLVVELGKDVFEDGKINLNDAPAILKLANEYKKLEEAVKGFKNIYEVEVKDLDIVELQEIVLKVYAIIKKVLEIKGK